MGIFCLIFFRKKGIIFIMLEKRINRQFKARQATGGNSERKNDRRSGIGNFSLLIPSYIITPPVLINKIQNIVISSNSVMFPKKTYFSGILCLFRQSSLIKGVLS
jgi:hypothetical protein